MQKIVPDLIIYIYTTEEERDGIQRRSTRKLKHKAVPETLELSSK